MKLRVLIYFVAILSIVVSSFADIQSKRLLVAVEGDGYLELVDGYRVLHLKGTPEQMGHQHGVLLRNHIRENVDYVLDNGIGEDLEIAGVTIPKKLAGSMLTATFIEKIPPEYTREMQALAKASQVPEWKITAANFIPELFHCSGFALLKEATGTDKLYHGRVLDYAVHLRLQEHVVLIIAEPEGKIPFVNITYAGFIGSVTGMNVEQISIGEMGGGGVGLWNGVPMSFLMRMVLENAHSLDEAISVFNNNPRTCEYYYVIADARSNNAVGMRCTPWEVELIKPGHVHRLLPNPVENTVLMSAGDRYLNLSKIVKDNYGKFSEEKAVRLMDEPVAMKHNLHNVLMIPEDGILYVANAAADKTAAWKQKYYRFDIKELMAAQPSYDK